jgi:hypothetical protein
MIVTPDRIQCGDVVKVDGVTGIVKVIDGPDNAGAYDLYITNGINDLHKVVTDLVAILPQ